MPGEVHEPRVEPDLRRPAEHDTFQIIVPMPMSDPLDLPEGPQMPVQEKLHRHPRIKPHHRVPRPSQDVDEAIIRPGLQPIDLGLFPGRYSSS